MKTHIAFQLNIVKATHLIIEIIYKKKTKPSTWVNLMRNTLMNRVKVRGL